MAEGSPAEMRRRSIIGNDDNSSDEEEQAKEIEGLKKRGILPSDFPVKDGGRKYDNEDLTQELTELLALKIISKEDVEALTNKTELTNEVALDTLVDPHVADHEQMLPPFASDGVPLNWSRDVNNNKMYNLVKLKKGDPEYDIIFKEFADVDITLKRIERLQSSRQLKRFQDELDDLKQHRDLETFRPNIRYLYHGTSVEKTRLCEEGLDQRLSRMGYFGKGIYFSDNPLKCVHYSDDPGKKNPDEAYILKCRVILGDAKVFAKGCYDTTLKREPEKDVASPGWRYYDSVVGCPKDFNEFVVYENRRAMIEYVISFQVDRKQVSESRAKYLAKQSPLSDGRTEGLNEDQPKPVLLEDHFARISEVREAVRRKRLEDAGKSYKPPSMEQKAQDMEMWSRLQKVHPIPVEHPPDQSNEREAPTQPTKMHNHGVVPSQSVDKVHRQRVDPPQPMEREHQHGVGPPQPKEKLHGRREGQSDDKVHMSGDSAQLRGKMQHGSEQHQGSTLRENQKGRHFIEECSTPIHEKSSAQYPDSKRIVEDVQQVLDFCIIEFLKITETDDKKLAQYYVQKAKMNVNNAILMYYGDIS